MGKSKYMRLQPPAGKQPYKEAASGKELTQEAAILTTVGGAANNQQDRQVQHCLEMAPEQAKQQQYSTGSETIYCKRPQRLVAEIFIQKPYRQVGGDTGHQAAN